MYSASLTPPLPPSLTSQHQQEQHHHSVLVCATYPLYALYIEYAISCGHIKSIMLSLGMPAINLRSDYKHPEEYKKTALLMVTPGESFLPDEKQAEVLPLNREQPPSHLLSLFTLVPRCSEGFTPNKLFRLLWDTDTSCYFTHIKSVISVLLLLPLPLTLSTLELTMDYFSHWWGRPCADRYRLLDLSEFHLPNIPPHDFEDNSSGEQLVNIADFDSNELLVASQLRADNLEQAVGHIRDFV
uniref:Uncharacterized protein n=1 Tax=Glossina palpalis gambiensis TaxID=67801 RepID=A0A1B0B4G4_9MUSC